MVEVIVFPNHSPLLACGEGVGGGVLVPHSTENPYISTEPVTYEEIKLLEIDVNKFPILYTRGTVYILYEFDQYDSLNGLVDVALEKWRQRL